MPEPPDALIVEPMATPLGEALIVTDPAGDLRLFQWADEGGRREHLMRRCYPAAKIASGRAPAAIREALETYFAGAIDALTQVPWRAVGTAFQLTVWRALTDIPVGTAISYGDLARRIGRPNAVRAVGLANGANPNGLVVPCHRVIGADGALIGYGGGLDRKRWLLRHEGAAFKGP